MGWVKVIKSLLSPYDLHAVMFPPQPGYDLRFHDCWVCGIHMEKNDHAIFLLGNAMMNSLVS